MIKVQRHHIKKDSELFNLLDTVCLMTSELKNEIMRIINFHYEIYNTYDVSVAPIGTYPNQCSGSIFMMSNIFQIMKDSPFMFRGFITSKVMKQVMKDVENNYRNYLKSLKSYYKNNKNFKGKPKRPQYRSNSSRYLAKFEAECIATTLNSGHISIGGNSFIIDIPNILNLKQEKEKYIDEKTGKEKTKLINEIKEIVIKPSRNGYELFITYEKLDNKNELISFNNKIMGIDIGVCCLMALTSNHLDWTPTMISGARIKNIITGYVRMSKYYKKKLGKNEQKKSKRLDSILYNFYNRKNDFCHKLSRTIVNMCIENEISKIVIGNNKFWKTNTKLGKHTRMFQLIPYDTIISMISYKAEEEGIEVITREESYTSKLSFLDLDCFSNKKSNTGNRDIRSLFMSKINGGIHADINGSLNIIRKEFGNSVFDIQNIRKYKKCPKHLDIKLN